MSHLPDAVQMERKLRRVRRRLWIERLVLLALVGVFVGLYVGALPGGRRVCLVAVEGDPVAVLPSRAEAERILDEIKSASGLSPEVAEFAQKVTFHTAPAVRHPVQPEVEAIRALSQRLEVVAPAAAILADGELVVGLPTQEEAVRALSMLLRHFSPPDPEARAFFREQVKVVRQRVPVERFCASAEELIEKLQQAAESRETYTVRAGDRAWKIAEQHGVSLTRLGHANPSVDLDRLRVGDKLRLPGELPPVTVVARRQVEERVGGRIQVVRITYENGVEVRREVIGRRAAAEPPSEGPPRRWWEELR